MLFFSIISHNIPISTLNLLSSTGQMEERASYNCWLSVKQAIGKWILTCSLNDNSSHIKFDNQHDAPAASTKAKVSAAIVLLIYLLWFEFVFKKFGLTEVNIIYLLLWTISSHKYLNILTFSVATENTLHRSSITICLKLSVPPPKKLSTCVISKSCNSFLKCLKNNAS